METQALLETLTTADQLTKEGRAFCDWMDKRKDSAKTSTYAAEAKGKSEADKVAYIQQYPNSLALLWDMYNGSASQIAESAKTTAGGQSVTVNLSEQLSVNQHMLGMTPTTNAQWVKMLSDGQTITPAGTSLANWLNDHAAQLAAGSDDIALAAKSFLVNVIGEKSFAPEAWFYQHANFAADLWAAYQKGLHARLQPTESVKLSPAVAESRRLQEAAEMRSDNARFIAFMDRTCDLIAGRATATKTIREAAAHYRAQTRAGLPGAMYVSQYPEHTRILKEIFTAYEREEGSTPPPKQKVKLMRKDGYTTPAGSAIVRYLDEAYLGNKLPINDATRTYVAYTQVMKKTPEKTLRDNPSIHQGLVNTFLTLVQAEIATLRAELDARTASGIQ